jgi:hypothetical protein
MGKKAAAQLINGKMQDPFLVESFPPFGKIQNETTPELVIRTSLER